MTRIDFYVFSNAMPITDGVLPVVCRLCEKAVDIGHRIYIHAPESSVAEALDSLLWSFRQGSFISHERCTENEKWEAPLPAVLIGGHGPPDIDLDIMINLDTEVPPFFSRFERVLELVHGDIDTRTCGRARYRFYRDRGYTLKTHDLANERDPR